jgi:hypothetical protein
MSSRLGQDTEYFLWDSVENKYVPSWEFLPQSDNKLKGYGFSLFRDGFAMELNTDAQTCRAYLWEYHRSAFQWLREELGIPARIKFSTKPCVDISHLMDSKDAWPADVKVLGCNPTMDAYTGTRKEIKRDPLSIPFRTSGAHMHISGIEHITNIPLKSMMFIKLCDLFIGLPLTAMFGDELEFQRRTLYGQAGEFRMQKYPTGTGIEYRVPSTRMYCHPAVMGLAFAMMRGLIAWYFEELASKWNPAIEKPLRKAINTGKGALEMLEDLNKMFDFTKVLENNEGLDRINSGGDIQRRFRMHNGVKIYLDAKSNTKPFMADTWLKIRANVDPDKNAEEDYPEAHFGPTEYLTKWYGVTHPEKDETSDYNKRWSSW